LAEASDRAERRCEGEEHAGSREIWMCGPDEASSSSEECPNRSDKRFARREDVASGPEKW
jgi:hypothetical protein